jgi:alkanesulfonate monooxygenase SsuD/methylene tetrahydromethanopterin reductase-like flavin-dependent oxidoreductase (luciferase family)
MQFDSVWASDHLLNDSYIEMRIGHGPYYSPLACLTYLAGVTKSIRLGTSVLTLPSPPVELANFRCDVGPVVTRAGHPRCGCGYEPFRV